MTDSKKIVIFGSVVQDLISYTDVFPRPGESVRGNSFLMGSGGKGANQAVAAARLGADVQLIARKFLSNMTKVTGQPIQARTMTDSRKIVIFGSVVQDLISYTDVFPRPGESVRGNSFLMGSGGKGANQAVAAARLGADVQLIARVGNDTFGRSNIEDLRQSGVDVSQMEQSDTSHTGTATITVNAQGENCIVVTLGANMELDEESAERHEETISNAAMVMTQAEVSRKGNRRVFEIAKKCNGQ
ncbi:unnamed protein product [Nippostrongylus brasiliensis]|uniref:Ribokinase (inferred by orthology to a human protein) n=1 Tax=Nippostrongylus brasiliensis TaxID=27835 RepID=A0A0N4YAG9_NIPBR|nr:unnamed protein product [Nippostrongylus brasiliensis]